MSQSTKRKHVTKEVLDEFRLPANNERIVQVLAGRGNNLHEVYDPNSEGEKISGTGLPDAKKYLVSMPTKFRKNVWIKRGDYVVIEPIAEGDKVKAEIVQILYKHQIKYIREQGQWPSEFSENIRSENSKSDLSEDKGYHQGRKPNCDNSSEEDSDDDTDLFQNTNRQKIDCIVESSGTSSSDD